MSDLREQHAADGQAARIEELTEIAQREYRAWLKRDGEVWGLTSFEWFAASEVCELLNARQEMTIREIFEEWDDLGDGGPTVSDLE